MIVVEHLTKNYGNHPAISDLNFTVETGKIYGFLGPNGAGKSTTMNIITGCLASTEGKVLIDGYDILENPIEAKKKIGYLPEIPPVYTDRTVHEYLKFVAELKKLPKNIIDSEIARVIAATGIEVYEDRLIKHLSKGYRQRVGIAEALLGDPEVIILDEPTVGLDPQQIIEIRELISSLREGHTVILSSHILSEVQAVSDMIIVINHGKIVALDTPDNLERTFAGKAQLTCVLEGEKERVEASLSGKFSAEEINSVLENQDGTTAVTVSSETDDQKSLARRIFSIAAAENFPILSMAAKKASLEDVFIELTKEDDQANVVREAASEEEQAPEEVHMLDGEGMVKITKVTEEETPEASSEGKEE